MVLNLHVYAQLQAQKALLQQVMQDKIIPQLQLQQNQTQKKQQTQQQSVNAQLQEKQEPVQQKQVLMQNQTQNQNQNQYQNQKKQKINQKIRKNNKQHDLLFWCMMKINWCCASYLLLDYLKLKDKKIKKKSQ